MSESYMFDSSHYLKIYSIPAEWTFLFLCSNIFAVERYQESQCPPMSQGDCRP